MEKEVKRINFYCERCREDWHLIAYKRWLNSVVGEAWQAKCPTCRKRLKRLSDTHAKEDPYFRKSRFTKMQLRKHIDSLIQPDDPRFKLLYPEQAKKIQELKEHNEQSQ